MDWEKVVNELDGIAELHKATAECDASGLVSHAYTRYHILRAISKSLKCGLESAQEAQSPAEDQPDP